jgi:calcium-dependent protein kinase
MEENDVIRQFATDMGICMVREEKLVKVPIGRLLSEASIESAGVMVTSIPHPGIHQAYDFIKVLGHGQFGTVREAKPRISGNCPSVAIKSINKVKLGPDVYLLKRELEILRMVDHPNVVKFYDSYEDSKYLHLVMELCAGGDVLERLITHGSFCEAQVADILRSLLLAVTHLHELDIVHRDLKPENFLYASDSETAEIKIIEFGMSNRLDRTQLHSMVGTPYYLAPEMLKGSYGKPCDVWALGVVMYLFLSGRQPFSGTNVREVFDRIKEADFEFESQKWAGISSEAKDLIRLMLTSNPHHRITAKAALSHPWFKVQGNTEIPSRVLQALKHYRAPRKLQQEAMRVVVKYLSAEAISELKSAFMDLDHNKTGFITALDLQSAMSRGGFNLATEEINSISKQKL